MQNTRLPSTALHTVFIALLLLVLQANEALAAHIPDGWRVDSQPGVETYTSPNGEVRLELYELGQTELSANQYLEHYLTQFPQNTIINNREAGQFDNGEYVVATTDIEGSSYGIYVIKQADRSLQVCILSVADPSEHNKANIAVALSLIKQSKAPPTGASATTRQNGGNANSKRNSINQTPRQNSQQNQNRQRPTQSSAGGVNIYDLRGIAYIEPKLEYDVFSGLFKEQGGSRWLLLKDGTAYRSPSIAPADFNVAKSRRQEPKRWTKWSRVPNRNNANLFKPLKPGTSLNISVSKTTSDGVPGTTFNSTEYFKLRSNGSFETSLNSFTGSNLSGVQGGVSIANNADKNGRRSTFGSQVRSPQGDVSVSRNSAASGGDPSRTGRYYIEGNTIELQFNNGNVVRKPFGYNKSGILLGATLYTP